MLICISYVILSQEQKKIEREKERENKVAKINWYISMIIKYINFIQQTMIVQREIGQK